MRFFLALEIPEESRKQLEKIQERLKDLAPTVRLTDSNKLHLTLAFLGEQPDHLKEDLVSIMTEASRNIPPFQVTPAYLDGFPNLHNAEVIWIGVKGDIDKLMIIRERIKDGLLKLGLSADERRYTPHITIAKANNFLLKETVEGEFQQLMQHPFHPIHIESIKLFESVPDAGFHKHSVLAEIHLG